MSRPSDMFLYSLSRSGGCVRTCDHGITFFDGGNSGHWDFEPGELEKLLRKQELNPGEYVSVDGGPESADCNGTVFVLDCDKCMNDLARYEYFVWSHRWQIKDFMLAKARHYRELAKEAEETAAAIRAAEWEGMPA